MNIDTEHILMMIAIICGTALLSQQCSYIHQEEMKALEIRGKADKVK